MPKYTLVNSDETFLVDGVAYKIRCDEFPKNMIHAIQFDSDKGKGWIEFASDDPEKRMPNMPISSFENHMFLVERWQNAKDEDEKKKAEAEAKRQELIAQQEAEAKEREEGTSRVQQLAAEQEASNGQRDPA